MPIALRDGKILIFESFLDMPSNDLFSNPEQIPKRRLPENACSSKRLLDRKNSRPVIVSSSRRICRVLLQRVERRPFHSMTGGKEVKKLLALRSIILRPAAENPRRSLPDGLGGLGLSGGGKHAKVRALPRIRFAIRLRICNLRTRDAKMP